MSREIVSRQTEIQVLGANGPVKVGKADDFQATDAVERTVNKHLDGSNTILVGGIDSLSGSLKVAEYDGMVARLMDESLHPGAEDPVRHLIVYTERYNDGATQTKVYTGVLFHTHGKPVARGSALSNDVQWEAEDVRIV